MKSQLQIQSLEDDATMSRSFDSRWQAGVAEGQNTKGYCRMKLMSKFSVHGAPRLMRFALREGLILQET